MPGQPRPPPPQQQPQQRPRPASVSPTRRRKQLEKDEKAVQLMAASADGTFDREHFNKFKSELDRYLHDEAQGQADPFLLSC